LPKKTWSLPPGLQGMAIAGLVIVNIWNEGERRAATSMLAELDHVRSDKTLLREVAGFSANRVAFTRVAANLKDPNDSGLKKALARVSRAG
jgi:hypothetical protein